MAAEVGFAIYEGHLGAVLKVFVYYTICEKRDRSDEFDSKKNLKKVLSTFIGLLGAVGGGIVMNAALFATQPWSTQELVPKMM